MNSWQIPIVFCHPAPVGVPNSKIKHLCKLYHIIILHYIASLVSITSILKSPSMIFSCVLLKERETFIVYCVFFCFLFLFCSQGNIPPPYSSIGIIWSGRISDGFGFGFHSFFVSYSVWVIVLIYHSDNM